MPGWNSNRAFFGWYLSGFAWLNPDYAALKISIQ